MASRDAVELLDRLVAIPSHASQPGGIREVAAVIGESLIDLGFKPVDPAPPVRAAPRWAEAVLSPEVGWDDLLDPWVWHRVGSASGELLLLGDLDAALALSEADCRLVVERGRARGPAVADMKAGLVTMVFALRRVFDAGSPIPSITVVLSGDEQAGSLRSAATLRRHGSAATWCLCFECGRDGGKLMRSRGHIGVGRLVARGTASHAGSALAAGVNAGVLLAHAIVALDADGVSRDDGTVTPTILSGGTRRSLLPERAEVVLDVRARNAAAWKDLEDRMLTATGASDAGSPVELEVFNHRPGLPETELTRRLLDLVQTAAARLGQAIGATDSLAAGSSAFIDASKVAVLDGFGPAGGSLMTPDEFVEIDSLAARIDLAAATMSALGQG